jgi:two-component system, OmpR family, sensor histidine kinase KdpD
MREKISKQLVGPTQSPTPALSRHWSRWPLNIGAALMVVALSTVILFAGDHVFKLQPISLAFAYFVPLAFIATRYGLVSATIGLIASTLLLAFIFFPPRFSLYVADIDELTELFAFFVIALIAIPIITLCRKDPAT